ncbi:hypothetical protein A3D85_00595 [Candidatus Amesbacteria bacterium RIFCSPHIGHO2_02_FULL_47_9]|uniref:DHHA1 domain-containing protein n=1 Tax=Candidatus Amesbacteria bacterium RIFCSPHIGHO2_01_FULL_48_32b TaxID=1797253 RepID=A0A1F4YFM8_9BACT|nr:MAG: hypothetical protein A2876_03840 [Candidatus Amesbacteria bacterium RIFCSPHIGHO2_01_FULL_48_32b]OGD03018.1 MAG: hypothetical protein A3D85_00595 [Candidatus Amesbacteria bacterium RIFCSPHIGHO2_02_FULL_47_9]OGD06839.1 MAG: hypothetical protein A2899_05070 [Candidatus Amesbacteria bacterium RIFCSPLOWO2_01_FULL_49_25]
MSSSKDPKITAVLYEKEPGKIGMSLRSNNRKQPTDVSILAARFGGGGHKAAAGGKFAGTLEEAEIELLSVVQKLYPGLGQP